MPVFIALSSLGNVFAQSFAMPRVKQELAKEGILPFSRLWASDWPISSPTGAIFLHWGMTVAFILGSQTEEVYTFVTNIFIYSGNWIKLFLAIGLLYLNFASSERWAEQRTTFRSSPLLTLFWILGLLFSLSAPFVPNTLSGNVPFFVVPTLGTSMLAIGAVYWLIWAKVLPAFGFQIQHEIVQMPDGSERVKYKVSPFPLNMTKLLTTWRTCSERSPKRGAESRENGLSGSRQYLWLYSIIMIIIATCILFSDKVYRILWTYESGIA